MARQYDRTPLEFIYDIEAAPTVAVQQCGRDADAYEVRCTDGNYEWRRPYHGELEVIMSTGRDRSGKPFEYRALFANDPASGGATPAEVAGLVERLRTPADRYCTQSVREEAASLIQSQAARIAELEARLRPFAQRCDEAVRLDDGDNDGVTVKTKHLRAARALLNGERKG